MTEPYDPTEPTGHEVDLSLYDLPPEVAPFATDYPPETYQPRDPMPGAGWSSHDDNE